MDRPGIEAARRQPGQKVNPAPAMGEGTVDQQQRRTVCLPLRRGVQGDRPAKRDLLDIGDRQVEQTHKHNPDKLYRNARGIRHDKRHDNGAACWIQDTFSHSIREDSTITQTDAFVCKFPARSGESTNNRLTTNRSPASGRELEGGEFSGAAADLPMVKSAKLALRPLVNVPPAFVSSLKGQATPALSRRTRREE